MPYQPLNLYGAPGVSASESTPLYLAGIEAVQRQRDSRTAAIRALGQNLGQIGSELAAEKRYRTGLKENRREADIAYQRQIQMLGREVAANRESSVQQFRQRLILEQEKSRNQEAMIALRERQKRQIEEQRAKQEIELDNLFAELRSKDNNSPLYAGRVRLTGREAVTNGAPLSDQEWRSFLLSGRQQLADPDALEAELKRLDQPQERPYLNNDYLVQLGEQLIDQGFDPTVVRDSFRKHTEGIPRTALEAEEQVRQAHIERFRNLNGLLSPASTVQTQQSRLRGAERDVAGRGLPESFPFDSAAYERMIDTSSAGRTDAQATVDRSILDLHQQQFGPVEAKVREDGSLDLVPSPDAPPEMQERINGMEVFMTSPMIGELGLGRAMAAGAKVTDEKARTLARSAGRPQAKPNTKGNRTLLKPSGPPVPEDPRKKSPADELEDQFDLFRGGLGYFTDG